MKKLSKDQEKQISNLAEALTKASSEVSEAVEQINKLIDDVLNPAIEAYNSALTDAGSFRDEVVTDMESYIGERSDKWSESDAGSNYESWKSDWEGWDASELSTVDTVDEPDMGHADELLGLSTEVDS